MRSTGKGSGFRPDVEDGPGGVGAPQAPDHKEHLVIERSVQDDRETLEGVMGLTERLRRKIDSIIEPDVRDVLEDNLDRLEKSLYRSLTAIEEAGS